MTDEWPLVLDGELVLHLVDEGAQLRIDDMSDLVGALYADRFEEASIVLTRWSVG